MIRKIFFILLFIPEIGVCTTYTTQNLTPAEGVWEFKSSLAITSGEIAYSSGAKISPTNLDGAADVFYGLNNVIALGGTLDYGSDSYTLTTANGSGFSQKQKGMRDVYFGIKGNYDFNFYTFYFGLGFLWSLEPNKYDFGSSSGNLYFGQNGINLKVGGVFPSRFFNYGGYVDYISRLDGKWEETSSSGSIRNYNMVGRGEISIHAFTEWNSEFHPNLELVHQRNYTGKGVSSDSNYVFTNGLEFLNLQAAGRYEIVPRIEIIPSFRFSTLLNMQPDEDTKYDKYDLYQIKVAGRFLF